ncbi:MAG TPA: 50S ribosomal protein L17 [Spirochaetota bacterium]|nr:50S ribosomal protein L17 [Spirochaetota bacterium]HPC41045.1 50S ribosomal protein L17 [Spirochaetota bacterium]HPL16931.1 50S ribosomal protein L17 [Spirochaetota bacterium]HQF08842.1 50S ribosomal protein L17 [Spirochaetota bacterium]HQH97461.1 50S ribosomal protein L17 [Spirochaetota bacterium]
MRHRNGVKQLGRTHAHRKAMFGNMVTSLFRHERIVTTKEKGKELKRISERLITRAKRNMDIPDKEENRKLHNKRQVMKVIKDRDIIKKLFEDIAPRYKDRKGGYTRIYLLGKRAGDAAEMSIIELVDKRVVEKKAEAKDKEDRKEKKEKEKKEPKKEKKEKEPKEAKAKKNKE